MGLLDGIKNVKEMMKMRSETKRIQEKINAIEAVYENGGVSVRVRGDMSVQSITIAPEVYEELKTGKTSRFETMLLNTVNGAVNRVKKEMQDKMRQMMMSGEMSLG